MNSNPNNQRQGNNDRRRTQNIDVLTKNFKGSIPNIDAVIGLKHEVIDRKKDYEKFVEKVGSYVSTSVKLGTYLAPMITDNIDPIPAFENEMKPDDLTASERLDPTKEWTWKEETKLFLSNKQTLVQNRRVVYNILYGQCSPSLQEVLMGIEDFKAKSSGFDVPWLLDQLRILSAGLDRTSNAQYQDQQANRTLINMRQKQTETNQAYFRRFQENVVTWELSKGKHAFYTESDVGVPYEVASDKQKKEAKEKYLALLLIQRSCITRYGSRIDEFEERDAKGIDEYPTTLAAAYDTLTSWELIQTRRRNSRINPYTNNTGYSNNRTNVSFLQMSDLIVEEDGRTFIHGVNGLGQKMDLKRHITCTRCHKKGHYENKCPEREGAPLQASGNEGTTMIQIGVSCTQNREELVNRNFIVLDSASTNSCFMNESLVKDIKSVHTNDHLKLISTGGTTVFTMKATCKLIPIEVWYKSSSLANILSLKEIASLPGAKVTMDTSVKDSIMVHLPNGSIIPFKQYNDGLFVFDTRNDNIIQQDNTKSTVTNYSFVSTVQQNKSFFTRAQIEKADRARKLQQYIGWPSVVNFKKYISNNLIKNTDVTIEDINRGEFIYGPPVPQLQGKMTKRHPTTPVIQQHLLTLPKPISDHHSNIKLCVDFFYVNGTPFLHTISRNVQFRSVHKTQTRIAREYTRHLSAIINKYELRSFSVVQVEGDNEFDNEIVRNAIAPRHLSIAGREEHVGPVERSIRTIKERARCICHSLPYKRYTKIMIQSLIETAVHWLNSFPSDDGVSTTLSPAAIVEGRPPPDFSMNKILFGAAAIVFTTTRNTMQQRGERAIALRETDRTGHYRFMSLDTGRTIHSSDWQEIPIDDFTINRVQDLALNEGQAILVDGFPIFEYAPGIPVQDPNIPMPVNNAPPRLDDEEAQDDDYSYQSNDEDQGAIIPQNLNDPIIFHDEEPAIDNIEHNDANNPNADHDNINQNEEHEEITNNDENTQNNPNTIEHDNNENEANTQELISYDDTDTKIEDNINPPIEIIENKHTCQENRSQYSESTDISSLTQPSLQHEENKNNDKTNEDEKHRKRVNTEYNKN